MMKATNPIASELRTLARECSSAAKSDTLDHTIVLEDVAKYLRKLARDLPSIKVIAEISGGVLQSVHSSLPNTHVELLDHDEDDVQEPDDERRELVVRLNKEIEGLSTVY